MPPAPPHDADPAGVVVAHHQDEADVVFGQPSDDPPAPPPLAGDAAPPVLGRDRLAGPELHGPDLRRGLEGPVAVARLVRVQAEQPHLRHLGRDPPVQVQPVGRL